MALSPKIGVKFTPEVLEDFFKRVRHIFCQEAVPFDYKLRTYGYSKDTDEFFMIWSAPECPEGTPVEWINPVLWVGKNDG